jgi:hypothetical protein
MNLLEKDNFLSDLSAELSKLMDKAEEYLIALSTYPDQILWTLDEYPELQSQIEEAFTHSKLYSGEEVIIDQLYTASYKLNSKVDYVLFRNLYQETLSNLLGEKVANQENLAMLIDKGQKIFITTVQEAYQHHLNELRGIYETFQQNILAPFFQLNDLMIQGDKLFEFQRATIPSGFEVAFETIASDLGKYVEVFEEISSLAKNLPTESDFEANKADIALVVSRINKDQYISQIGYVTQSLAIQTKELQNYVKKLLENQIDLYDLITIVQSGEYEDEYVALRQNTMLSDSLPSHIAKEIIRLEAKQEEGAGDFSKEIEQLNTYAQTFSKFFRLATEGTGMFMHDIYLLKENLIACAKREH